MENAFYKPTLTGFCRRGLLSYGWYAGFCRRGFVVYLSFVARMFSGGSRVIGQFSAHHIEIHLIKSLGLIVHSWCCDFRIVCNQFLCHLPS